MLGEDSPLKFINLQDDFDFKKIANLMHVYVWQIEHIIVAAPILKSGVGGGGIGLFEGKIMLYVGGGPSALVYVVKYMQFMHEQNIRGTDGSNWGGGGGSCILFLFGSATKNIPSQWFSPVSLVLHVHNA